MDKIDNKSNELLSVSFNQDGTCFSVGTEKGFEIYLANPFKSYFERRKYIYIYNNLY